jgi:hypothetical protein
VDEFYQSQFSNKDRITSISKENHWGRNLYSLTGNFYHLEDRFKLIRGMTGDKIHFGVGTGYHIIDNTFAMDIRFSFAHPAIMSLYVLPGYYYDSVGGYTDKNYFHLGIESVIDPIVRKRMNIAGIGVYTIEKKDWASLEVEEKRHLSPLKSLLSYGEETEFLAVEDLEAYPTLYVAKSVVTAKENSNDLLRFRFPLQGKKKHLHEEFVRKVKLMETELNALRGERQVLLEHKDNDTSFGTGSARIINWVGPRIMSEVECSKAPCLTVFNSAWVSGWHAFVKAEESKVEKANYAFLSTRVPVGKHLVWFEWRPKYYFISLLLSLFTGYWIISKLYREA